MCCQAPAANFPKWCTLFPQ